MNVISMVRACSRPPRLVFRKETPAGLIELRELPMGLCDVRIADWRSRRIVSMWFACASPEMRQILAACGLDQHGEPQ